MIAAKKTKSGGQLIPAVAYVRMSTDNQEDSPKQQREEIRRLALAHGCEVIREYTDEGISGAEMTRRRQFSQLLKDAERGEFQVILCWDQDRFSRADAIDTAEIIAPLRRAGIRLITVAQGEIDWHSFAGRLIYTVQQEGKNQFLQDHARNQTRGIISRVKEGRHHGRQPWGYDRIIENERGEVMARVPFGQVFRKPEGWRARLVPTDDETKLALIRRIFERFADSGVTLNGLIRELNFEGIPAPMGGLWKRLPLEYMLTNWVYAGSVRAGTVGKGKFFRIGAEGEIEKGSSKRRWFNSNKAPIIITHDAHEPIIDRKVFDRVQKKLLSVKRRKHRPRSKSYFLTGVLRCGHCGSLLHGKTANVKGRPSYRYYACPTMSIVGAPNRCMHTVRADELEAIAVQFVQESILSDENAERVKQSLIRQAKRRESSPVAAAKALRSQLDKLDRQIERAVENVLALDPEFIPAANKKLQTWRDERRRVAAELQSATHGKGVDAKSLVESAMNQLHRLREGLQSDDPLVLREVMGQVFADITLYWSQHSHEKQIRRPLARAVVNFSVVSEFAHFR